MFSVMIAIISVSVVGCGLSTTGSPVSSYQDAHRSSKIARQFTAIANFIARHQPTLQHPSALAQFHHREDRLAVRLRRNPTQSALWVAGAQLVASLHDAHTFVSPPQDPRSTLPVAFFSVAGGVVADPVPDHHLGFRPGDRVLTIGPLTPTAIVRRLQAVSPGNVYWRESNLVPYLQRSVVLRWLGVVRHNKVNLTLRTPRGRTLAVEVPLVAMTASQAADPGYLQARFDLTYVAPLRIPVSQQRPGFFFFWQVNRPANYAVFWLLQCDNTPAYRAAADAFFHRVAAEHVTRVVLDLQEDGGGNSDVVNPWYDHLAHYTGKLYVLINGSTFSSAVLVSELLATYQGAILVGQPSGLGASGYGNVVGTTIGGLYVQTSTVRIEGPNGSQAPALIPTISVPVTLADVWHHINPIQQWLLRGVER